MTDWLMVIITAIYVVATIYICRANIRSAEATREQLAESKRQFEEGNRAYITYSFIYEKRAFYGLRFTNNGKRVAKKVKIVLSDDFIKSLKNSKYEDRLKLVSNNECVLGVGQSIDVFFGGAEFRNNTEKLPIEGDIMYFDDAGDYCEHFIIDFNSYPPIFTVNSEIEDLRQELKHQTAELKQLNREIAALKTSIDNEGVFLSEDEHNIDE